MIVKNESKIIKRCLDSVKPLIDYVFIVDTGSDDDTINVINDWLLQNKENFSLILTWSDKILNKCSNARLLLFGEGWVDDGKNTIYEKGGFRYREGKIRFNQMKD